MYHEQGKSFIIQYLMCRPIVAETYYSDSDIDILDLLTVTNYIHQNLTAKFFRKSFMYSGAAIWNSLPLHVTNATSVNTFKCLYLKWKRLNDH